MEKSSPPETPISTPDNDKELEDNQLWRVISKQVQTLRAEMEESRKSAEDAEKNNTNVKGSAAKGSDEAEEENTCRGCAKC